MRYASIRSSCLLAAIWRSYLLGCDCARLYRFPGHWINLRRSNSSTFTLTLTLQPFDFFGFKDFIKMFGKKVSMHCETYEMSLRDD